MKLTPSEVLGLINIGEDLSYPFEKLKPQISITYPGFSVETVGSLTSVAEAYDSHRGQYHSTRLLVLIEQEISRLNVERLLGVTNLDLFVPGMNFVFGEARCPGRVGIISTHRLKPNSANESELFRERVVKEAIHEIGHMLGLRHCSDPLCVMHFSVQISDTDRKRAEPCINCKSRLEMFSDE